MTPAQLLGRIRRALHDIRAAWPASADPPRVHTSSSSNPPQSRPPAGTTRADTHSRLARWARAAHTPTDPAPPLTDTLALTHYLDDAAPRLAATWDTPTLTSMARDLTTAARDLRDLTDPYPRQKLGDCHLTPTGDTPTPGNVNEGTCGGPVYADPADPTPGDDDTDSRYQYATCDRCGSEALITWWQQQWTPDPPQLVTTDRLVKDLAAQGIHTNAATIRWRLHKGQVYRSGTTKSGDSLWDVGAVVLALTLHTDRTST